MTRILSRRQTACSHGQELFDFGHALRPRHAGWASGALHLPQDRLDVALAQSRVEGTHGVNSQVNGRRGLLALGN